MSESYIVDFKFEEVNSKIIHDLLKWIIVESRGNFMGTSKYRFLDLEQFTIFVDFKGETIESGSGPILVKVCEHEGVCSFSIEDEDGEISKNSSVNTSYFYVDMHFYFSKEEYNLGDCDVGQLFLEDNSMYGVSSYTFSVYSDHISIERPCCKDVLLGLFEPMHNKMRNLAELLNSTECFVYHSTDVGDEIERHKQVLYPSEK